MTSSRLDHVLVNDQTSSGQAKEVTEGHMWSRDQLVNGVDRLRFILVDRLRFILLKQMVTFQCLSLGVENQNLAGTS